MSKSTPAIALLSIQRPLFRGDKEAVFRRSVEELRPLCADLGLTLAVYAEPLADAATAVRAAAWLDDLRPDFALAQLTTFATGEMLLPLADAGARLGFWAVEEGTRQGPLPLNSLCGLNMYANILGRSGRVKAQPFKWFYGFPTDPLFAERFRVTAAALRAIACVHGAKIGQIGGVAPAFYGLEANLDAVAKRFGVSFEHIQLDEFYAEAEAIPESEVQRAAGDMASASARCDATAAQIAKTARIEAALRSIIVERGLDATGLRCWPEIPDRLGSMPCAAVGRVMDDLAPVACEGDPLGAIAMLALGAMARQRPMMMDLADWDRDDGTVLMWHCGNTPKHWADERGDTLTPHFNRTTIGTVRQLVFRDTTATVLRLVDDGAAAFAFTGRFCKPDKPSFDGARGWMTDFRVRGKPLDSLTLMNTILARQLPHHYPLAPGDLDAAAREFAAWYGIELLEPLEYSAALISEQGGQ